MKYLVQGTRAENHALDKQNEECFSETASTYLTDTEPNSPNSEHDGSLQWDIDAHTSNPNEYYLTNDEIDDFADSEGDILKIFTNAIFNSEKGLVQIFHCS